MREEKWCQLCGRRMEWRKAWEDCWEEVRYCSASCRKRGLRPEDKKIEQALVALLAERGFRKTICPSEVVRTLYPEDEWRSKMERVRQAARRLTNQGTAEILQGGVPVDPSKAKGPIRIRRKR